MDAVLTELFKNGLLGVACAGLIYLCLKIWEQKEKDATEHRTFLMSQIRESTVAMNNMTNSLNQLSQKIDEGKKQ